MTLDTLIDLVPQIPKQVILQHKRSVGISSLSDRGIAKHLVEINSHPTLTDILQNCIYGKHERLYCYPST